MKSKFISLLFPFLVLFFIPGCVDESSEEDGDCKVNMLTRSWYGEEFFIISLSDTSFKAKDFVHELSFARDGSYFFYKYTMSSMGRTGHWTLIANGDSLRLTDATMSEVFFVRQLSLSALTLGDTNSRGFALVPSQQ
jgi:hypothetical protein